MEEKQKDCRLYIDSIGDILATHMSYMDVYMVIIFVNVLFNFPVCSLFEKEYCVNHGNAIKVLQTLREEKPNLGSILQVRIQPHE